MVSIRFHGRGGQGAVVAARILATALMKEGWYSQSMPKFGGERRGAPVRAFVRFDDKKILVREEVTEPDHVVVLDASLVKTEQVDDGLKAGGWIIINTSKPASQFPQFARFRVAVADAGAIAVRHRLGSPQSPVVNTAVLGAVSKALGIPSPILLFQTIQEEVPAKGTENAAAAREAFNSVGTREQ